MGKDHSGDFLIIIIKILSILEDNETRSGSRW